MVPVLFDPVFHLIREAAAISGSGLYVISFLHAGLSFVICGLSDELRIQTTIVVSFPEPVQ